MSDDKTLASNVSNLGLSKVGTAVLNGLFLVLAGRALSIESYGHLSFALTLVIFGLTFADGGVSKAVTRRVANENDDDTISEVVTTAVILKGVGVLLVSLVIVGSIRTLDRGVFGTDVALFLGVMASLVIAGFGLAITFAAVCRGFHRIEFETGGTIINDGLRAAVGLYAVVIGTTIQWIFTVLVVGAFLRALVPAYGTVKQQVQLRLPQRETVKSLLWFGLPLGLSTLGFQLLLSTDRILVGYLKNSADLGLYQAAFTVTSLLLLLPNILKHASYPISADTGDDEEGLYALILMLIVGLVFPAGLVIAVHAELFVTMIFGSSFSGAAVVLSILVVGILVRSLSAPVYPLLVGGKGEQIRYSGATAVAAVLNVILNVVLIPPFGLVGAATATCISFSVDGLGKIGIYKYKYGLSGRNMTIPLVGTLVSLAGLLAMRFAYLPSTPGKIEAYITVALYLSVSLLYATVVILYLIHFLASQRDISRIEDFLGHLPFGVAFQYYFRIGRMMQ